MQPTEEGQICFAAAERTWCPLGQAMMVAALPGKALRAEGPLQVLLTWGSPFQAGPLLWNVLKIKSDSLSRRAMQRMLHGSATEQMCCGFLSKLRAVEKPCSAACQEGITAQGLVVTGACDGVHKLSEHTSCSGWMLFHSVWSHWVFTETPCETATLGTQRGWGLGSITTEQERCHICITFHPPVLLGKHLCFAQDRWHIIWDTQSQWHRDTTPLSLWARWSLGFYPTPTIPWFQLHWNSGAQCWLQTKTTSPGQPNQKTEQSLNTGLRRTRILCVQTRNLKSQEQTQFCFLLLTWAFIFLKQAARQVPKSPMKCRLKIWCAGAAGSAHFTMGSVQGSATATVTNLGLRKRQAPDSPLINERGIRALYPRRQIAVLSKMCTTINLSLKARWFGFQSSLLGNQREEASRRPSCFEEWTTLVPH